MKKKIKVLSLMLALSLAPKLVEAKEKVHIYHVCTKQDSRQDVLACAMYAEGRGEGVKGMSLIGNTIINRTNSDKFPDEIKGVVFQKKQFSYTSQGVVRVKEKKSWKKAQSLAKSLIYLEDNFPEIRSLHDPSKNATMFHKRGVKVYWSKMFTQTVVYKQHIFYR